MVVVVVVVVVAAWSGLESTAVLLLERSTVFPARDLADPLVSVTV